MLIRLFGKNFRSLKDDFELSMVAADLKNEGDLGRGVVEVAIDGVEEPLRLLRTIAIYGHNGSGKSTVLAAARALNWLATKSSIRATPEDVIPPYEPFSLDDQSINSPVELGCDVIYQDKILRYEISFGHRKIHKEALTVFRSDDEVRLIDRNPKGKIAGQLFKNAKANSLYVEKMQPHVTVLSKLAQHGPREGAGSALSYYQAIQNATGFHDYSGSAQDLFHFADSYASKFADDAGYREWIMGHLMRPADVGISDVRAKREDFSFPPELREQFEKLSSTIKFPDKQLIVSFIHNGKAGQPIDFSRESSGTKKLFNIASDWWTLAHKPVTFFVDELSASLHPRLLDSLIRGFNEVPSNRVKSQLIFSTHDTGLLEGHDTLPPALRRDQVYFTRKNEEGASELYSLAEFKDDARSVHNIRKRYLSGRYGALPSVEKLPL